MRHLWGLYKVVQIVDKQALELESDKPIPITMSGYSAWSPTSATVKLKYAQMIGCSITQSHEVVADALRSGYLEGRTELENDEEVDTLRLTYKGRELIDGFYIDKFFLPMGLWLAWAKTYSPLLTALLALGVGVFIKGAIALIWQWLLK